MDRSSWGAALLLTTVSGLLYGIAFPPLALRPLAWIALAPLLLAIRGGSLRRAVLLGALWTCVMTYITSDCLPGAVITYYKQSALVGWLMLLGATLLTALPYYASFAAVYWILSRAPGAALPVLTGAAWVAAELGRVTVLGGNPWAVSGYSQTGVIVMQIADVTGVHGVGFVLAMVNAALVELCLARRRGSTTSRATIGGSATGAGVLLVVLVYGTVRLQGPSADSLGPPVEVAIAQGNLDLGRQWRRDMYGTNLDDYLRLTYEATRAGATQLVFWPESAMTFYLADEPAYQAALGRVLGPGGLQLIAGGPRVETVPGNADASRFFNATYLVSPAGKVLAWQDKTKLLPFAEYFPLESLDLLRRDFGQATQFTPGASQSPLPSVAGAAGVVVCNESMYPEVARERVRAGAEYLVNPANDSWFGDLKYSLQAFDIARWRAVETRRYLVRTSTAGPSAIVDPLGRIVVETAPFTRSWIKGEIRPSRVATIYHEIGDLFALLCVAATVGSCATAVVRSRS